MRCAQPHCSCGTVDGAFCSEACVAAQYESNHGNADCGCGHTGCQPARV